MKTLIVLIVVGIASPAMAQRIQPPPRSAGGLFGGRGPSGERASPELSLTMNVLGGYDSSIAPEGQDIATGPQQGGYVGTASAVLNYWQGRSSTSFLSLSGRSFVNTYTGIGVDPMIGGDIDLSGMTELGRRKRTRLTLNAGAHYLPQFMLTFGTGAPPVVGGSPDYGNTQGVTMQSWTNSTVSPGLERDWNVRQRTSAAYQYAQRAARGSMVLDSHDHTAFVRHTWDFRRNAGLNASFRHVNESTTDATFTDRPFRSTNLDAGLTLRKAFSRTRRIEISGGGGAMQSNALNSFDFSPYSAVTPSYYGSLRLDVLRTWSVSGDVRRTVTILEGITPQPFNTDVASVSGGGMIGKFRVAFTTAISQGNAYAGESGSFDSVAATSQLDYNISTWVALMANYTYYDHLIRDVSAVPFGFPPSYDRQSLRVGFTILLPFYGTFQTN